MNLKFNQLGFVDFGNKKFTFKKSKYSRSGEFAWSYSLENAELVFRTAYYFNNTFELLKSTQFYQELNLHKSVESVTTNAILADLVDQSDLFSSPFVNCKKTDHEYFNSLEISQWAYKDIVISATYCVLENIYLLFEKNNHFRRRESLQLNLTLFCNTLSNYLIDCVFSDDIFGEIKLSNIFTSEPIACIKGYLYYFEEKTQFETDFFERIHIPFDSTSFYPFLQSFDFHLENELCLFVSDFCKKSKSAWPTIFILQKYKTQLIHFNTDFSSNSQLNSEKNLKNFQENISSVLVDNLFCEIINKNYVTNEFFELEFIKNNFQFYDLDSFFEYVNIQQQRFFLKYFFKWYFFGFCSLPLLLGIAQLNLTGLIFSQLTSPIMWQMGLFSNIGKVPPVVPETSTLLPDVAQNPQVKQHVSNKKKIANKKSEKRVARGAMIRDRTKIEQDRVKKESSNFLQHCPNGWIFEQLPPRNKFDQQRFYVFKDKSGTSWTVNGNFGSYKDMISFRTRMIQLMKAGTRVEMHPSHIDHLANDKTTTMCGVSRDKALCIFTNADLNHYKEQSSYYNPAWRNFSDCPAFQGNPMQDILQDYHRKGHNELFAKLEANPEYMQKHGQHHEMVKTQYNQQIPNACEQLTARAKLWGFQENDETRYGAHYAPATVAEQHSHLQIIQNEAGASSVKGETALSPESIVYPGLATNRELAIMAKTFAEQGNSEYAKRFVRMNSESATLNLASHLHDRVTEHHQAVECGLAPRLERDVDKIHSDIDKFTDKTLKIQSGDLDTVLLKSKKRNIGNTSKKASPYPEYNTSSGRKKSETFQTGTPVRPEHLTKSENSTNQIGKKTNLDDDNTFVC